MTLFGLHPTTLLRFYGSRVRRHPVQELLAASGIAVGVALVFAVEIANTSITGSATQVIRGLVGDARLQIASRSADGFPMAVAARTARVRGVKHAVPVLRARVTLVGTKGRRSIELVGATSALPALGGELARTFGTGGLRLDDGIAVPAAVTHATGAAPGGFVQIVAAGRVHRVRVGVVLRRDSIGSLADSQAAVAQLRVAQRLVGRPGRLSQVLVVPRSGQTASVRRQLHRIAAGRLTVAAADRELALLRQAARPNDQSTDLFAAIAAMVGFLFAFNAMLLTSGERRRFIADLRMQGFDHRQVVCILAFEGLTLGVIGSVVGLVLGEALSRLVFHDVPEYLAFAFPVGTHRIVESSTVVIAAVAGVVAALLASLRPLLDLRRGASITAVFRESGEPGEALTGRATQALLVGALAVTAATTAILMVLPSMTILGGVLLAVAVVLVTPAVFSGVTPHVEKFARRTRRTNLLVIAIRELTEARARAVAVAAVGALAVYGSVAIEGAHRDLLRGLDRATKDRLRTADLWVTSGNGGLTTESFPAARAAAAIRRVPGVEGVRSYRSSLLDAYGRRMWVIGRPRGDGALIPRSQLMQGDLAKANRRLQAGGWLTISRNVAEARDIGIGDAVALPTPTGASRFRVAAITTNIGWVPGVVILNARDYQRAWGTADPAALEVELAPGARPVAAKRAVQKALGRNSALKVETTAEHEAFYRRLSRQGLARLTEISTLLLIAAALAMALAMSAAVWQRRRRLAALKVQGYDYRQLWGALLQETALVAAVGGGVGAVMGTYGHALASRYLELSTAYPTPFALGAQQALLVVLLVSGIALAIAVVPGLAAAKVPARMAFDD